MCPVLVSVPVFGQSGNILLLDSVVDPNSFFSDSDPQIIYFGFGYGFGFLKTTGNILTTDFSKWCL
jgi:hypothetical protein